MTPAPFVYNATVLEVVDGDTFICRADRGMRDYSVWSIRILGINCAPRDTDAGQGAKRYLEYLLPVGEPVLLYTVKPDKFGGRLLARVEFDGGDLATRMLRSEWALPWNGRGPAPIPVGPSFEEGS